MPVDQGNGPIPRPVGQDFPHGLFRSRTISGLVGEAVDDNGDPTHASSRASTQGQPSRLGNGQLGIHLAELKRTQERVDHARIKVRGGAFDDDVLGFEW
jgi:hypothetical protein